MVPSRAACVIVAACLGGVALAGGGSGSCFEQMWSGIKQSEDLGGKKCAEFSNCPKSIRCYAGRISLTLARTEFMSVMCRSYSGGTWDPAKGRCVGGTLKPSGPMSEDIWVEVCVDACN
jgi:hypothetical protein